MYGLIVHTWVGLWHGNSKTFVLVCFFSIPQPVLMCVSGYCFDAGIVVSKFKVVLEITEVVCLLRYSSRSVKRASALK